MNRKKPEEDRSRIRCAIYTRKSTEEGLDQQFNSLDAQREAAEAYIRSQKCEGWVCLPKHYNDGGFSGGNLDRPAYNELMKDIEAGEVDCVIVYKVDRLSRSLFDFAQTMKAFDASGVSFVSVTQQFNTTNSMGRLTLNILLSFAQFEREIISERISDKIAAQRQKGLWCGGQQVLGYDVDRSSTSPKLVVSLEKAEADASTRANNGWRATVGTLKDASIEFTVLNKDGDSAFGLLQGLWSSGDPCDVGISDAGGTLTLTCEVMTFNVNQNLEEVISADVTLKPTQPTGGGGMNVGPGLAGP